MHWSRRLCSESIGSRGAPRSRATRVGTPPAATMASLFASPTGLPASTAAYVASNLRRRQSPTPRNLPAAASPPAPCRPGRKPRQSSPGPPRAAAGSNRPPTPLSLPKQPEDASESIAKKGPPHSAAGKRRHLAKALRVLLDDGKRAGSNGPCGTENRIASKLACSLCHYLYCAGEGTEARLVHESVL